MKCIAITLNFLALALVATVPQAQAEVLSTFSPSDSYCTAAEATLVVALAITVILPTPSTDATTPPVTRTSSPCTLHLASFFIKAKENYEKHKQAALPGTAAPLCTIDDQNLCLLNRFASSLAYVINGISEVAIAVQLTGDSGYFKYHELPNTLQVVSNVVDGCELNGRYWFFAAGLTDVDLELDVADMKLSQARGYTNPQGRAFPPIQDTGAFATCP